MKALITGPGGLIGSECARHLCAAGWEVAGVDNFGAAGTTAPVVSFLKALRGYTRHSIDIRDRQTIRDFFASVRPDFIIHTAAQPSHDRAAAIPYDDFDVNAVGTLQILVAARDFCPAPPLCFNPFRLRRRD